MSRILGFFSEKTTDTGEDLTTKGDLHGYSDEQARVPIGNNDYVLTADSSEALGLKWAQTSGLSSPLTSNLVFNDNVQAAFGTGGSDSYIKHDGSNMYIKSDTGSIILDKDTRISSALAFCDQILQNFTIASGAITLTGNVCNCNTEGSASSDDLTTCDATASDKTGAMFTILARYSDRTVNVIDSSGSIQFLGAGDFSLDTDQDTIIFSALTGATHNYEISRSSNS